MGGDERLEGLHGWLILIGFIIVTGALSTAVSLIELADQGLRGGTASRVSWFAIGVQLTLAAVQFYIMYLFFMKKRQFPNVFSLVLLVELIVIIVLGVSSGNVGWATLIGILFTVPQLAYIMYSRRVTLTFTQ